MVGRAAGGRGGAWLGAQAATRRVASGSSARAPSILTSQILASIVVLLILIGSLVLVLATGS